MVPCIESLEERVLLSFIPVTSFYVPDSDGSDLVVVKGGIPYGPNDTPIANNDTSQLCKIVVPNNNYLKIYNKGDGITDGDIDILGGNIKSISLGKTSGEIKINAENIRSISSAGDLSAHIFSSKDIKTISVKGRYSGSISAGNNIGNIRTSYLGYSSALFNLEVDIDAGGKIGSVKVSSPLEPKLKMIKGIPVIPPAGYIDANGNEILYFPNESVSNCTISSYSLGKMSANLNIKDTEINEKNYLESLKFSDSDNLEVIVGGDFYGVIGKISARNMKSTKINAGVFEKDGVLYGLFGSKINSISVSSISDSTILDVNPDTFKVKIGKKTRTIGNGVSYTEDGNDLRAVDPIYTVEVVRSKVNGAKSIEYRFISNEQHRQHFMTLINTPGVLSMRTHPGADPNGWGSSLYLQPFLPGATLKNTSIRYIGIGKEGIQIYSNGKVSRGDRASYGFWNFNGEFNYNPLEKKVNGDGTYSITLKNTLNSLTGDLNLLKIASNYLDDVPLLSGGVGDTGDMAQADVSGDNFAFSWIPENQPAHFPNDRTNTLSIDVSGQYNNVDTAAQGYAPIAAAYKPSMKIVLSSQQSGIPMIFGGIYDTSKSQQFYEDNVGITPLVLKSSLDKKFDFNFNFESQALPGDN